MNHSTPTHPVNKTIFNRRTNGERNPVNQKFIKFIVAFIISDITAYYGFIPSLEYLLLPTFMLRREKIGGLINDLGWWLIQAVQIKCMLSGN